MNIEALLSKSINKFKQTIKIVLPLIILYTIISYMWTPAFLHSFSIDQDFNYALTEFSIQDIIFGLLLLISFNLYTSVINQFIFVNKVLCILCKVI